MRRDRVAGRLALPAQRDRLGARPISLHIDLELRRSLGLPDLLQAFRGTWLGNARLQLRQGLLHDSLLLLLAALGLAIQPRFARRVGLLQPCLGFGPLGRRTKAALQVLHMWFDALTGRDLRVTEASARLRNEDGDHSGFDAEEKQAVCVASGWRGTCWGTDT